MDGAWSRLFANSRSYLWKIRMRGLSSDGVVCAGGAVGLVVKRSDFDVVRADMFYSLTVQALFLMPTHADLRETESSLPSLLV